MPPSTTRAANAHSILSIAIKTLDRGGSLNRTSAAEKSTEWIKRPETIGDAAAKQAAADGCRPLTVHCANARQKPCRNHSLRTAVPGAGFVRKCRATHWSTRQCVR